VAKSTLRIRLLGGLEVEGVDSSALGSRKGRLLLKRLAITGNGAVPVDAIIDTLWPDGDEPARPADQVSVLVSRLRRALGSSAISYTDGAYTLAVDWLDVDELRQRADEAERRLTDGSPAMARAAATAALALVRGPLLPEDAAEQWTQIARASADRLVARVRHVAAAGALAGGLPWEAAEHAAAALAADPYDEAALRVLMRAYVASGRPALALSVFAATAELVAGELGADLAPETQALHLTVLRGEEAAPIAPRSTAPLIGRTTELAALDGAFARALTGSAVVVSVEGEAGIGKTRLLSAFADAVADSAQVLRATAEAVGVLPMEPLLDMLTRHLTASPEDERTALLGSERDLLGPLLWPGVGSHASAYRDLLVAHEPGEQSAPAVLHLALLAVVRRLCARRPVVMLLDDAHLADDATIGWLGLAVRHGSALPLLAVAAGRPSARPLPSGETITVGRLGPDDAAAVVAPYIDATRLDAVVERSAGLPLFLVELSHATGDALPDTIRDSVVDRIADVGAAAATLRAAAVLGAEVDVDLLATVLERPTRQLLDDLDEGARRRLLDDAATGYVFHHELIREALDADTASARRAWLHREAAHVLASRLPADHLRVAHHARQGGDAGLAAHSLCAAAAQAGARFDHAEALRLVDESLRLAATPQAHLIRARSFVLLRRYDEARRAAAQADALGAGGAALEVAAFAAYYARDLDAVLRLADRAPAVTDDHEVLDTSQYLAVKVLHTRGQLTEALARLAPIADAPMRSRIAPFARAWRCLAHLQLGHVADAAADLDESARARVAPVPYAPLYLGQFETHLLALQGRPLDALAAADRLSAAVAEQNALRFVGRAEVYRGWALSLLCAPAAVEALEQARAAARAAGNPEPLGQGSLDLAAWWLDHDDADAAASVLGEVDDVLDAGGLVSNAWRIELRAHYLRGRLALLRGDRDAAAEAAAAVIARSRRDAIDRYEVLGALLAAEVAATAGEAVEVQRVTARLPELASVARPEAWRIAARLGRALRSDALLGWSESRVAELLATAGPHAEDVRRAATRLTGGR
jgi:DNA-binding SARP family transcriptional activator